MPIRLIVLLLPLTLFNCAPKETLFNLVDADTTCTIVLDLGHFETVRAAHDAYDTIDWFDDDTKIDNICRNALAALELQKHLCLILNVPESHIPIANMNRIPTEGNLIFIGSPQIQDFRKIKNRVRRYWRKHKKITDQDFRIDSFMTDTHQGLVLSGPSSISTLYAVYELLTRWGVRWFSPESSHDYIPIYDKISIYNMHFYVKPSFNLRGFWMDAERLDTPADSAFIVWMGRNRLNLYSNTRGYIGALKQRGIYLNSGRKDAFTSMLKPEYQYRYNHPSFVGDDQFPIDPYIESEYYQGDVNDDKKLSYGEAHPEWFGIEKDTSDHRHVDSSYSHICLSYPEAVTEFSQTIVDKLIYGTWATCDIVDLWTPELWCTCEKCQSMGNDSDKLLYLMYHVNQAIQKANEDDKLARYVYVHGYARNNALQPPSVAVPKDFHTDNTAVFLFTGPRCFNHYIIDTKCTDINIYFVKDLFGWFGKRKFYRGDVNIAENYNADYFHSLPAVHSRIMAIDIPAYAELGVSGLDFMHVRIQDRGVQTLTNYQFAREVWDAHVSTDTLKSEFFAYYYPGISEMVADYYARIEQAMSTVTTWRYYLPQHGYKVLNALADSGVATIAINERFLAQKSEHPVNFNELWENTYHQIFEARYIMDTLLAKELPDMLRQDIEDLNHQLEYAELLVNVYDNIYTFFTFGREEESIREEALYRLVENRDKLAAYEIRSPLFGPGNGLESSGVKDLVNTLLDENNAP